MPDTERENLQESSANDGKLIDFLLEQNYPNPFNPTTKIKFSIPSNVTFKAYYILGREVATLINEVKPAGNYEVEFEVSSFTSEIYFY